MGSPQECYQNIIFINNQNIKQTCNYHWRAVALTFMAHVSQQINTWLQFVYELSNNT